MRMLRDRMTYANVMATMAFFLALSGGAVYAAEQIGSADIARNAVKSKHIRDDQVKRTDIRDNAINSEKVENASLLGEDFAPGQLPQGERGPSGATNVTVRSVPVGNSAAVVSCQAGERATGGGVDTGLSGNDYVWRSRPVPQTGTPTGWEGGIDDPASPGVVTGGTVYVICASP